MDIQELKTFLEKEVKAKRFLNEAIDYVAELKALENRKAELTDAVAMLHNDHVTMATNVDHMQGKVDVTEQQIIANAQKAEEILVNARDQAYEIEMKAEREASAIVLAANEEASSYIKQIVEAKQTLAETEKQLEQLSDAVTQIKEEKAKLLATLGG